VKIDVLNVTLTFNIDISVENDVFNEALMLKRQSQGELMIRLNIIVYYGKNKWNVIVLKEHIDIRLTSHSINAV
jgi:hypothetical protein